MADAKTKYPKRPNEYWAKVEEKRRADPDKHEKHKEQIRARYRERYANDPVWREHMNARAREYARKVRERKKLELVA
jgi:hypothetical protein